MVQTTDRTRQLTCGHVITYPAGVSKPSHGHEVWCSKCDGPSYVTLRARKS